MRKRLIAQKKVKQKIRAEISQKRTQMAKKHIKKDAQSLEESESAHQNHSVIALASETQLAGASSHT